METKIRDNRKFKLISDVDFYAEKTNFLPSLDIFDCIFNIKDSKELLETLKKKGCDPYFISNCLQYSILIRPKLFNKIIETLRLFSTENKIKTVIKPCLNDLLQKGGIIGVSNPSQSTNGSFEFFPKGSIEHAIINDNVEEFNKFLAKPLFNIKVMIKITKDSPFYFVEKERKMRHYYHSENCRSLSYSQLICLFGSINCLKSLISHGYFDAEGTPKYAIAGGNNELIHLLEKNNVNFNNCFEVAVKYHMDSICDWLLNNYRCETFNISKTVKYYNNRAFYFFKENGISATETNFNISFIASVKNGDIVLSRYLYSKCNADVNYRYKKIGSALHFACKKGDLEMVKYLINEYPVNVEFKGYADRTAFWYASECDNLELIKYLVEEIHVNVKEISSEALNMAIKNNRIDILKYLYEKCHPDIKQKDFYGKNALHTACENENIEIVKYLVEVCKMDVSEKTGTGKCEDDKKKVPPIIIACKKGNIELVKYFIEECHVSVEEKMEEMHWGGRIMLKTPLCVACEKNHLELVKYLFEKQHANFNDGFTNESKPDTIIYFKEHLSFYETCKTGDVSKFKELFEKGPYTISQRYNGKSPLHIASFYDNLDLFKYLVEELHADINEKTEDDQRLTPFCIAGINGNLSIIKYLVEKCNVNVNEIITDKTKRTTLHIACDKCNFELVQYLVETCHVNIEAKDYEEKTALHFACENGNIKLIKYLIEKCHANINSVSKVKDKEGHLKYQTVLTIACDKGNVRLAKYLVEEKHMEIVYDDFFDASEGIKKYFNDCCKLFKASKKGNVEEVKRLVEKEHYSITQRYNRKTALHIACQYGKLEVVKYFVEDCLADIEEKTNDDLKCTALYFASESNNLELVKYLIEEYYANIEFISKMSLHCACENNNFEMFKYLVEKCNVSIQKTLDGNTVFFTACKNDCLEIAKYLFNNFPSITSEALHGNSSSFFYACENGNYELVKFLINQCHYSKLRISKKALFTACEKENIELVKFLVEKFNLSLGEHGDQYKTLLIIACQKSNTELAEYIVQKMGASGAFIINCKDDNKKSALTYASNNCNLELVRFLIEKCNANTLDISKLSLLNALKKKDKAFIKYLVDRRVFSINEPNDDKNTALDIVCEKGDLEMAKFLIEECKANIINIGKIRECESVRGFPYYKNENIKKMNSLHHAIKSGNFELVKYLIENCSAAVNEKVQEYNVISYRSGELNTKTSLHIACEKGNMEIVKYLIEKCHLNVEERIISKNIMNYKEKTTEKNTALQIACENGNLELVKYLVEECHANVGSDDNKKKKTLICALSSGNVELFKYLVNDCNIYVKKGDNKEIPLMKIVCMKGCNEIVKYLIEEGYVNVNKKLHAKKTLLHIACEKGNIELAQYLIKECYMNVDEKDDDDKTALHIACEEGNYQIVKFLVEECNADILIKSKSGTALQIICKKVANSELSKSSTEILSCLTKKHEDILNNK